MTKAHFEHPSRTCILKFIGQKVSLFFTQDAEISRRLLNSFIQEGGRDREICGAKREGQFFNFLLYFAFCSKIET